MSEDDVGSVYVDAEGVTWQLISYTPLPTATLERLVSSSRRTPFEAPGDLNNRLHGVVGARIFEGFRKLVPEGGE